MNVKDPYELPEWLPLDFAAEILGRRPAHIRSQIRLGKLERGEHFRPAASGGLELNLVAYVTWVDSERARRKFAKDGVLPAPPRAQQTAPPPPARVKLQPKLIPLSEWAELMFGEHQPHRNTLRSWVQNGKIVPFPVQVGRRYFCSPDARYFDPTVERINRMVEGR
ncbi:excisionase [Paraburkholderia bannensis]|uniref:excisionase n=1 Tax=Paraburkholderia bannensis TaxID=765414 RepID=UPI002AC344E9|nr:excisionase [Paraburkholderia bannensis]